MIRLPLMTDEDLQRSMELEGPKYKILVVDASFGWLLTFARVYERVFDIRTTETCPEAVALATDADIDLVLWDPYPFNLGESLADRLIKPMRRAGYEGPFVMHLDRSRGDTQVIGNKIRTLLGESGNEIRHVLSKPANILHVREIIRRSVLPF